MQSRYQHVEEALQLHDMHQRKRLASAFADWQSASARIQSNNIRAEKAKSFFLGREAMDVWKAAMVRKNEAKVAEQMRVTDLRSAFDGESALTDGIIG